MLRIKLEGAMEFINVIKGTKKSGMFPICLVSDSMTYGLENMITPETSFSFLTDANWCWLFRSTAPSDNVLIMSALAEAEIELLKGEVW